MYKKLLILIFIINFNFCYSQNLNGKFSDNKGYYLYIDKNYVEFFLPFTTPPKDYNPHDMAPAKNIGQAGHGKIIFDNQYIIIEPKLGYVIPSVATYNFIPDINKSGIFKFRVFDTLNNPMQYVGIYYYTYEHSKRCQLCPYSKDYMTNESGKAEFEVIEPIDSTIDFTSPFGYQELRIKLKNLEGGVYDIQMKLGHLWYDDYQKITLYYEYRNDTLYYRYVKIGDYNCIKPDKLEYLIKRK